LKITLERNPTTPAVNSIFPSTNTTAYIPQAHPCARIIPFITLKVSMVVVLLATPPPESQITLLRCAPLVKITFDCAATENAPANLKTNIAPRFF
jgi:hypothetical protein